MLFRSYKDLLIKQLDNQFWGVYNILSKDLINDFYLKSCALIAAKEYSNRHYEKYHNIKLLDNKYASVTTDAMIFKNNITTITDDEKYHIMLTRLEESNSLSHYYQKTILKMFRQTFV